MPEQTVRVLREIRDYLVTEGWTKGISPPFARKRCLVGASYAVARGTAGLDVNEHGCAVRALRAALDAKVERENRYQDKWVSLADWNDRAERTFGDVLELIDEAIELESEILKGTA